MKCYSEFPQNQQQAVIPHLAGADTDMLTSSIVSNLLKTSIEARISPMVFCKKVQRVKK